MLGGRGTPSATGTSAAILIARALLQQGERAAVAGLPQPEVVSLMEAHACDILGALEAAAQPMPQDEDLDRFAAQALGGDLALGRLLAQAHRSTGAEGLLVVEEARGVEDALRIDDGLHFDQGWLSPQLVDDQRTQTIEFDDPLILLHAGPIAALEPILRVLQMIAEAKRSLLIVAESVGEQALATLVANKRRAGCGWRPSRRLERGPCGA